MIGSLHLLDILFLLVYGTLLGVLILGFTDGAKALLKKRGKQ